MLVFGRLVLTCWLSKESLIFTARNRVIFREVHSYLPRLQIDQARSVENCCDELRYVDVGFHDFGCSCGPDVVNGKINIVVYLVFVSHVFMAFSHEEVSFVLRKGNVRDLVHVVGDRNEVYSILGCLSASDSDLVSLLAVNIITTYRRDKQFSFHLSSGLKGCPCHPQNLLQVHP